VFLFLLPLILSDTKGHEEIQTFTDYYKVLGVPSYASSEEIKKAYRRLAKRCHPDVNPGDKKAEEQFKGINEAHGILSDPLKRRDYDNLYRNHFTSRQTYTAPQSSQSSSSAGYQWYSAQDNSRSHGFASTSSQQRTTQDGPRSQDFSSTGSQQRTTQDHSQTQTTANSSRSGTSRQSYVYSSESMGGCMALLLSMVGTFLILAGIGKLVSGGSSLNAIASATVFFLLGLPFFGGVIIRIGRIVGRIVERIRNMEDN
jgi:cation transport ATPase